MPSTLELIYQSHYQTLLTERQNMIFRLEAIHNQIAQLEKEARKAGVQIEQQQV